MERIENINAAQYRNVIFYTGLTWIYFLPEHNALNQVVDIGTIDWHIVFFSLIMYVYYYFLF